MFIQYKKNDLECLIIHIKQNEYCTNNDKTKDEVHTETFKNQLHSYRTNPLHIHLI